MWSFQLPKAYHQHRHKDDRTFWPESEAIRSPANATFSFELVFIIPKLFSWVEIKCFPPIPKPIENYASMTFAVVVPIANSYPNSTAFVPGHWIVLTADKWKSYQIVWSFIDPNPNPNLTCFSYSWILYTMKLILILRRYIEKIARAYLW